jgi:hypothetical protein
MKVKMKKTRMRIVRMMKMRGKRKRKNKETIWVCLVLFGFFTINAYMNLDRFEIEYRNVCDEIETLESTREVLVDLLSYRLTHYSNENLERYRKNIVRASNCLTEYSRSIAQLDMGALRPLVARLKNIKKYAEKTRATKEVKKMVIGFAEDIKVACVKLGHALPKIFRREEAKMRMVWDALEAYRARLCAYESMLNVSNVFEHDEDDEVDIDKIKATLVRSQEQITKLEKDSSNAKSRLTHIMNLVQAMSSKSKECPVCFDVLYLFFFLQYLISLTGSSTLIDDPLRSFLLFRLY